MIGCHAIECDVDEDKISQRLVKLPSADEIYRKLEYAGVKLIADETKLHETLADKCIHVIGIAIEIVSAMNRAAKDNPRIEEKKELLIPYVAEVINRDAGILLKKMYAKVSKDEL